ncbi:MAG: hypothetical protein JWM27_2956 [Gemmatimonadetes bacterium]|nr:hypothetical protein [Gemmatimonadota bacterium]
MASPGAGFRGPFWRVFPWDAAAAPGEPHTPQYTLPRGAQTGGRFDLSDVPTLYLALDDPAHALAEVLQSLRGTREIRRGHLHRVVRGQPGVYHPLALVETWVPHAIFAQLPDLGDPQNLVRLGIRPDDLSSRERSVTQRISRKLHDDFGLPGFTWWSAFGGEWHVAVLFMDRVHPFQLRYGPPEALDLAHPVVQAAAAELKVRVAS